MAFFIMSRSYRKTPMMGHTTCRSERHDKFIWHKKWRLHERLNLIALKRNEGKDYLPIHSKEVSSVWWMGKDGKQYFPLESQLRAAKYHANNRGRSPQEHSALKKRLSHKWMGK
jgi:hypothetical protein